MVAIRSGALSRHRNSGGAGPGPAAHQARPTGDRWFADPSLEGDGFEHSVPGTGSIVVVG